SAFCCSCAYSLSFSISFNDTPTTEFSTLSLHDALPISCFGVSAAKLMGGVSVARVSTYCPAIAANALVDKREAYWRTLPVWIATDRKSTRLNSSHVKISYAVFCLKKKKK